jgi:hypothetical protein
MHHTALSLSSFIGQLSAVRTTEMFQFDIFRIEVLYTGLVDRAATSREWKFLNETHSTTGRAIITLVSSHVSRKDIIILPKVMVLESDHDGTCCWSDLVS